MFKLLKYIQPTWYFNIPPGMDHGYFPAINKFYEEAPTLKSDNRFEDFAKEQEFAYRANRSGIIDKEYKPGIAWWENNSISLKDEYLFARKHFHSSRVLLSLLLRIFTFNNPVKELAAFCKTLGTKKISVTNLKSVPDGFYNFPYRFPNEQPLISVIIPTLNRYKFLADVLHDLEKQDYQNFVVIVVDQSDNYNPQFYKNFNLKINLIRQEEKALWLARNTAIRHSLSKWIALAEDDIRIPNSWLSNHMKCVEFFNVEISNGIFFPAGQAIPENKNFFKWSDQFATGNAFLHKDVFRKTGLFDRNFEKQRMGDGEFGLRAYKAGIKSIMNPLAWCEDLKAPTGGLRESGNWDAFRPESIWSPRPVPSVLYFYRKYFGTRAAIFSLTINVPPSIVPYRFKRNKKYLIAGIFLSVLLLPLIMLQVMRSWKMASKMLKNQQIQFLNEQ